MFDNHLKNDFVDVLIKGIPLGCLGMYPQYFEDSVAVDDSALHNALLWI